MVHVSTPRPSLGAALGNALGGIGGQIAGREYGRYRTLQGLEEAKQAANTATTPTDKLFALLQATAGRPGAEKALGQILPLILSQSQRAQGAQDFPIGGIPQQGNGSPQAQSTVRQGIPTQQGPEGAQVPVSVSDLVPARPGLVADPTGVERFQLPYNEQDIANIRQLARQKGYTQDLEDRFVADALEMNKVAETRRNVELSNYQQEQKQRQDVLENQALFTNYIRENGKEFANNPDELQLALKASEKFQNLPSFADRLAAVRREIRPYQQSKKALEKTLKRPLFGQTKEQRSLARPRAQEMVRMGQKDQLRLMIANGGQGEAEEADLINPLPEKLDNDMEKGFPKFVNPLDSVKSVDPSSENYAKELKSGQERRGKQEQRMLEYLTDNIKPGTYEQPGTNLLLIRKHLMDKNLSWDESGRLIDQAISQGKIQLDPHQKIDYQKLAYPPLTGETYTDTILNNLMFPITGKQ